jgi:hypothetical protein
VFGSGLKVVLFAGPCLTKRTWNPGFDETSTNHSEAQDSREAHVEGVKTAAAKDRKAARFASGSPGARGVQHWTPAARPPPWTRSGRSR